MGHKHAIVASVYRHTALTLAMGVAGLSGCFEGSSLSDSFRSRGGASMPLSIKKHTPLAPRVGETVSLEGEGFSKPMKLTVGRANVAVKVRSPSRASFTMPDIGTPRVTSLTATRDDRRQTHALAYAGNADDYPLMTGEPEQLCVGQRYYDAAGELMTGTRVCGSSTTPCTSNGDQACVPSGAFVAATARATWDLTTTFPGAGYYDSVANVPSGSIIKQNSTVLGIAGALEFPDLPGSGIHHTKTSPGGWTLRQELESGLSLSSLFATGRHEIPRIASSDDGYSGTSVTKASRPSIICGRSATTIQAKIADCATANPTSHRWIGASYGNAGEGSWTLVSVYPQNDGAFNDGQTCAAASYCREVWRDDRTLLIWSDWLANPNEASGLIPRGAFFNWCQASGSNNKSGSPYAELDPSEYCGNATNTDTAYQYGDTQLPVSLCAEDAAHLQTPSWTNDEKGGLHAGSNPAVRWRLPTKYDWEVAEVNGIRHVMAYMDQIYWSSSVQSTNRQYAWRAAYSNGYVATTIRSDAIAVRCVGRP